MHPLQMFNEVEFIVHDDVAKLKEVHGFVKAVIDNKQPVELSFFPAHHNSIVALLGVLQIDVGAELPQYDRMLAFEVYEDKASQESLIKLRSENEEVFYADHTWDPLCSFSHFESLTLEFQSYSVVRLGHSRHNRSKYTCKSNSCPTRPKRIS
ncbi:hypothetical protein PRNP1_014859 [Phytophthora ramorum]